MNISGNTRLKIRWFYIKLINERLRKHLDHYTGLGFPEYYSKNRLIFVHIPKAAGTTFAYTLYDQSIAHLPAAFIRSASPQKYQDFKKVSITRNPYSRLVSAYHFVKQGGTEIVPVYDANRYSIAEFKTFEDFVLSWLYNKDVNKLDFVFKKQTYFLPKEMLQDFDHIGKLENIADTKSWFVENCDVKSFSDLNRLRVAKEFSDYYSNKKVREVVYEIYKDDFLTFGYKPEL